MLPEDLNFLKGQDESPHNWGGQNKIKREQERNQNRTFAPERELYRGKLPHPGNHPHQQEINQDGGSFRQKDSSATILKNKGEESA